MEKKSLEQIRKAMIKVSFLNNSGKGARVCYPNEVLAELFGTDILDKEYIMENEKCV